MNHKHSEWAIRGILAMLLAGLHAAASYCFHVEADQTGAIVQGLGAGFWLCFSLFSFTKA